MYDYVHHFLSYWALKHSDISLSLARRRRPPNDVEARNTNQLSS